MPLSVEQVGDYIFNLPHIVTHLNSDVPVYIVDTPHKFDKASEHVLKRGVDYRPDDVNVADVIVESQLFVHSKDGSAFVLAGIYQFDLKAFVSLCDTIIEELKLVDEVEISSKEEHQMHMLLVAFELDKIIGERIKHNVNTLH